jgi:hypothetical protein
MCDIWRFFLDHKADRRYQTPITESGFAGMAVGAALAGLKPICEFSKLYSPRPLSIQAADSFVPYLSHPTITPLPIDIGRLLAQ